MMNNEKVKAFMDELTELSRKHGIVLDSCGCCNSIALLEFGEKTHRTKEGSYHWRPDNYDQINWENS